MSTEERLRKSLQLLGVNTDVLLTTHPVLSSGIIDSFSLVSLLDSIEDAFQVRIESDEIGADNFDTISQMAVFIDQKSAYSRR